MGWIKRLLGIADTANAASDRISAALIGIADDLEEARRNIRHSLGIGDRPDAPTMLAVKPAPDEEEMEPEPAKKGRKVASKA